MADDELDQAIDEVCNRFEAAWDAFLAGEGKRPALEEHLQQVAAGKEKSFALLLKVDIEKRLGAGEEPISEEYSKQFPVMKNVVDELLPSDAGLSPTRDGTRKRRAAKNLPGQIGPYKILQTIGEGGMGSVYLAQQTEPIRRRVALKVIKAGMDTKQVVARFEAERQALAMMDHQNIAKVLDAGVTEQGQPFFAMELVKGIPITKYCDKNKLPLNDRLDLFVQVCRAIQHAHQKGVIHRDLKPSNVLVTLYDGVPIAKVIDFGLAKALQSQQRLTDKTLFTEFGRVIGTLEYMSPRAGGDERTGGRYPHRRLFARRDALRTTDWNHSARSGTNPFRSTASRCGLNT